MDPLTQVDLLGSGWELLLLRLGLAFLLGAVLGLEREQRERPAGLRTHVLVCLASCLAMMLGLLLITDPAGASRVAQGVLTGVGFLGAGTIIRQGSAVRGLTTAATIWAAACIGLAAGLGWYLGAIAATVLVVLTLTALQVVEAKLHGGGVRVKLEAQLQPEVCFPAGLLEMLGNQGVEVQRVDMGGEAGDRVILWLHPGEAMTEAALEALVRSGEGVREVRRLA